MNHGIPRRKFSKTFKKEALQKVRDHDGDIDKVARELDIHPLMLQRWYDEAEGRLEKWNLVEDYKDTYWIRTKEDLLSSYMIHLWKNHYFDTSEAFEPDPSDIDFEQLRFNFLASTTESSVSGLYNEENPLFDLLPGYPELEPMIEELRQSQEVDLLTASKIYDEWNSNYRSKVKSEEEAEKERIQNLSTDELCLTILEDLDYENIHLDDRDIELYKEYYIKMQELHFNELKKRKIERKLTFFINKMAEWSRKYNLAAAEYQMTQANLRSKFMKDALVVSNKLKNQFQQIYETMTNSGAHLLLLDHGQNHSPSTICPATANVGFPEPQL